MERLVNKHFQKKTIKKIFLPIVFFFHFLCKKRKAQLNDLLLFWFLIKMPPRLITGGFSRELI